MAYHVELEFAFKTDTGRVRSHNEDAIAISEECGFAILADGMGGYNAGEVASSIATSVLKTSMEAWLRSHQWDTWLHRNRRVHQLLADSIADTNTAIIEAARAEPDYAGMGTTLAVALFYYDRLSIAHVGDSRIYRIRQGEIVQLTKDHSLLQEQIDAGIISEEDAQFAQTRNLITRAMGVDHEVQTEINEFATEAGDIYLLCSDGLSDMLSREEIHAIFSDPSIQDLQGLCNTLIDHSNVNGGRDNISAVLVKIQSSNLAAKKSKWKFFNLNK